jgi:hypothetical protein
MREQQRAWAPRAMSGNFSRKKSSPARSRGAALDDASAVRA